MANYVEEKVTFGKLAKSQSHYGTTSKATTQADAFLKHTVEVGDTVQGVAVKYGVTIEQVRRTNNLWTNDSLFLREFLLIPVPSDIQCDDGGLVNSISNFYAADFPSAVLPESSMLCRTSPRHHGGKVKSSRSADSHSLSDGNLLDVETASAADVNQVDINEYFSKYDALIDKLKRDAVKLDEKNRYPNELR